ncbi:MAG: acyltransferase family protein, partial [Ktedonobacterales bacterium]
MTLTATVSARADTPRWRERLVPLSTGPHEIRAMDGLRALAALSVLVYHALASTGTPTVILGHDVTWVWFYTESGVDLFFVLSGFLL